MVNVNKHEKYSKSIINEDHICILTEPGSKYVEHVTPDSGSSRDIAQEILECFHSEIPLLDFTYLRAIGCDGTVVNTGSKNEVVRQLEKAAGRSLQWLICQLHANELPPRNLLQNLDGKTKKPSTFTGTLGKKLKKCDKIHVYQNFQRIEAEIIKVKCDDLSTDQKYLPEIHCAISKGIVDHPVFHHDLGTLCHSRWFTTANKILRLYVTMSNPSENLLLLTKFIV